MNSLKPIYNYPHLIYIYSSKATWYLYNLYRSNTDIWQIHHWEHDTLTATV